MDYLELLKTTEYKKTICYNKENQQSTSGKRDQTESDYGVLEQPAQLPTIKTFKRTIYTFQKTEHNKTINSNKKFNNQHLLEKNTKRNQLMLGSVQVLYKQVFPNSGPPTPRNAYIAYTI